MEEETSGGCRKKVSEALKSGIYPWTWLCNKFLATFRSTTLEEKARLEDPCYERYLLLSLILPLYIICILLYAPVAFVCFVVWIAVQSGQPSHKYVSQQSESNPRWNSDRIFQVTSINTYLMPEFSARYYNLGNTQERAQKIARALTDPDSLNPQQGIDNVALQYDSDSELDYTIDQDTPTKKVQQDTFYRISIQFPKDLDVVCFQGVFEYRAQKTLIESLQGKFPYIVSDCEVNSWSTNRFRWPSGLVVASRWPIINASFKPFSVSCDWDKNVCKGILAVKVCTC